jgi:hypothetical protein
MDDKAHAAIGGVILGSLFVGLPVGIFMSHDPEPEVRTKYEVVHVPRYIKVETEKEVVKYRDKPVVLPEVCTKAISDTESILGTNSHLIAGAKRWLEIASNGRVAILDDSQAMITYRQQLDATLVRLDEKNYATLSQQSHVEDLLYGCKKELQEQADSAD